MIDVGPVLALIILVGALCIIVGAKVGQRLVVGGLLAAVLLPPVSQFLRHTTVDIRPISSVLAWLLGTFVVVIVVAGWLAYVNQRRRLAKWREPDQPKLGAKRRIEPD